MFRIYVAACAILLLSGCSGWQFPFGEKDNFKCGVREGDKATYCDGANEQCVCATNRCAVRLEPANMECASGYVYLFAPQDCVEQGHVRTLLTRNDHETFCPQEQQAPPPCGGADGAACAAGQVCLCGLRSGEPIPGGNQRCAVPTPACDGGFAYAAGGDCVPGGSGMGDYVYRRPEDPVCPGFALNPPRCGVPGALGNIDCSAQEVCICGVRDGGTAPAGLSSFICARQQHDCRTSTGRQSLVDRDGRCLEVDPLELVLLRPGETTCPGAGMSDLFPDAGTDPLPDGGTDGDGGVP